MGQRGGTATTTSPRAHSQQDIDEGGQGSLQPEVLVVEGLGDGAPEAQAPAAVGAADRVGYGDGGEEAGARGSAQPDDEVKADMGARMDPAVASDTERNEFGHLPQARQDGLIRSVKRPTGEGACRRGRQRTGQYPRIRSYQA